MSDIVPRSGPGRPTLLDKQPGLIELVAELYSSGMNQDQMLENLPISTKAALRRWLKDERVVLQTEEIMRERSLRIRRKVDGELEKRLGDPNRLRHMPEESLLKIRKEMSSDFADRGASDAEHTRIIEQLYLAAANNPAAAELIAHLNLDPDGTTTVTAEEVQDADVVDDADEPPPIDVDAALAEAFKETEDEPEGGLEL